jgi:hypothetical protein
MLRHENQPGSNRRAKAIGARARAAGWPVDVFSSRAAREAQIRSLRRLERMDFTFQGRRDAGLAGKTTAGRTRGFRHSSDWAADDGLASIFDE